MDDDGNEKGTQKKPSPEYKFMERRRRKSRDKMVKGEVFENLLVDISSDSPTAVQFKNDIINLLDTAKQPKIFNHIGHRPKFRRSMAMRCYNDNHATSTPMQKHEKVDIEASLSSISSSSADNNNYNVKESNLPDVELQDNLKPSSPDKIDICTTNSDHKMSKDKDVKTNEKVVSVEVPKENIIDENLDRTIMRWRCLSAVERRLERATNRFTRFTLNKRSSRSFISDVPKNNSFGTSMAESEPPPKRLALIAENEVNCLVQTNDFNSHEKYHKATSRKTINTEVQTSQPLINEPRLSVLTECIVKLERHFADCHKSPVKNPVKNESNQEKKANENEESSLLNGVEMVTPKETYKRRRKNGVLNNKLAKSNNERNVNKNEESSTLNGFLFVTPKERYKQKNTEVISTRVKRHRDRFLSPQAESSHSMSLRSTSKNHQIDTTESNFKRPYLNDSNEKPWRFSPESENNKKAKNSDKKINIIQHFVVPPPIPDDDDSGDSNITDMSSMAIAAGFKKRWSDKSKLNIDVRRALKDLMEKGNEKNNNLEQADGLIDVEEDNFLTARPLSLQTPEEKSPNKQTKRKKDQTIDNKIIANAQIEASNKTKLHKKYQPDEKIEVENEFDFDDIITVESVNDTTKSNNFPIPNGKSPKTQHKKTDHLEQRDAFSDVEIDNSLTTRSLSSQTPEEKTVKKQTRRKKDQITDNKITAKAQIETSNKTKLNKKYQPDEKIEVENETYFDDIIAAESVNDTANSNGKSPKKQYKKTDHLEQADAFSDVEIDNSLTTRSLSSQTPEEKTVKKQTRRKKDQTTDNKITAKAQIETSNKTKLNKKYQPDEKIEVENETYFDDIIAAESVNDTAKSNGKSPKKQYKKTDHLEQADAFSDMEIDNSLITRSLSPQTPEEKTPKKQTRKDQTTDNKIIVKAQIETSNKTKSNKKYQPDEKVEVKNDTHFDESVNDTKSNNLPLPNGKLPKGQYKNKDKNNTNELIVKVQIENTPTSNKTKSNIRDQFDIEKPNKDENKLQSPGKVSAVVKANNKRTNNKSKPSPIRKKGKFGKSPDLDEILVLNNSRPKNKNISNSIENTGTRKMLRTRSKVINYNEKKPLTLDVLTGMFITTKESSERSSSKKRLTESKTSAKVSSKKRGRTSNKNDTVKEKQDASKKKQNAAQGKPGTSMVKKKQSLLKEEVTSKDKQDEGVSDSGIDECNGATQDMNLTTQEISQNPENVQASNCYVKLVNCLEKHLPPLTRVSKLVTGIMEIVEGKEKPLQHLKFYLVFTVVNGTADVIVQDIRKTVKKDESFFVPKDTDYSIINVSQRETLRLIYCYIG